MKGPLCQDESSFFRRNLRLPFSNKVNAALQRAPIHDDVNQVSVLELADRPACQCFGANMANTSSGGNTGEPGIGDERHIFAKRQILERRRKLIRFLHPGP
ncbi:hypothetical protein D3C76_1712400 [compost metagenome]